MSSKCNIARCIGSGKIPSLVTPDLNQDNEASSLTKIFILITKNQEIQRSNDDQGASFSVTWVKWHFQETGEDTPACWSLPSLFFSTISQLSPYHHLSQLFHNWVSFYFHFHVWVGHRGTLSICSHTCVWVQVHGVDARNHPQLLFVWIPYSLIQALSIKTRYHQYSWSQ